jgi:hypothetical protein
VVLVVGVVLVAGFGVWCCVFCFCFVVVFFWGLWGRFFWLLALVLAALGPISPTIHAAVQAGTAALSLHIHV